MGPWTYERNGPLRADFHPHQEPADAQPLVSYVAYEFYAPARLPVRRSSLRLQFTEMLTERPGTVVSLVSHDDCAND